MVNHRIVPWAINMRKTLTSVQGGIQKVSMGKVVALVLVATIWTHCTLSICHPYVCYMHIWKRIGNGNGIRFDVGWTKFKNEWNVVFCIQSSAVTWSRMIGNKSKRNSGAEETEYTLIFRTDLFALFVTGIHIFFLFHLHTYTIYKTDPEGHTHPNTRDKRGKRLIMFIYFWV